MAVVIPCYNQGQFLAEAVASARAQTHPNIQCLVVDDGSTDPATLAVISALEAGGLQVIRQANQGLATARNTGFEATEAPFVVPLDADDRLRPEFVETLLPALAADLTCGYCYADARLFGAEERVWRCPEYDPLRLLACNLSSATALIRRQAFQRAGGYQADMVHGFEDWDFWIAMHSAGFRGRHVPEVLFEYRRHDGGSMLTRLGPHRNAMIQRMIEHHTGTFAALLGVPRDPDEIASARAALVRVYAIEGARLWTLLGWTAGLGPLRPGEDPRPRLARIEGSRAYRLIRRFKALPLYTWYARRRYGPALTEVLADSPFR